MYWTIRQFQQRQSVVAGTQVYLGAVDALAAARLADVKGYTTLAEILDDEDFWGVLWM